MKQLFLLTTLILALCVSAHSADEAINIQIGGEPATLEPARALDQYAFGIIRNTMEGLFKLDPDGNLQLGLAEKHSVSKDGLTYRFKIRKEAKWSDGKEVSPQDFVLGLRHAVDPKTACPNADSFFAIKNAEAIFNGKADPETLGVRVERDEVVIELAKADPIILFELTLPAAMPLREDIFQTNKGKWNFNFPVTGAYLIKAYRPADRIELEPNKFARKPGKKRVVYHILQEEIAALNLLEAGRFDIVTTIPFKEIERLKPGGWLRFVPSTTVFYYSFNVSKPPFNDINWRKAVASVIDRDGIEKTLSGAFHSTISYLPAGIEGHVKSMKIQYSDAVEKLKNTPDKPRIKVAFGASAFTRQVNEKVQNDLSQKLGLQADVNGMELKMLLGQLKADPPDMYFLGMSAVFKDPLNQLHAFSSATAPNFSRYSSPEFEKLLESIKATPSGPKRNSLAEKANRLLVEKDVVVVPVVVRTQVFGISKRLKGFHVSPYQVINLAELTY